MRGYLHKNETKTKIEPKDGENQGPNANFGHPALTVSTPGCFININQ